MIRSQVESWPPPTLGCTAHVSTRRKNLKMQTPPPPHRDGRLLPSVGCTGPAQAAVFLMRYDQQQQLLTTSELVSRAVLSLCHPLRLRALPSVRNSGTPPRPQTSEQAPGQRPREAGRGRRAGRAGAAAQAARPAPFTLLPEATAGPFSPSTQYAEVSRVSRPAAPPCPRPSWVTHAIQAPRIEHLELQERSLTRPGSRGGNLGTRAAEEGMRASRECPREHPVPFKEFSLKTENSVTLIYARRGPRTPLHFLQDEGGRPPHPSSLPGPPLCSFYLEAPAPSRDRAGGCSKEHHRSDREVGPPRPP